MKSLIFLITLISFLSLSGLALAADITLANPLCSDAKLTLAKSACGEDPAAGPWQVAGYSSLDSCYVTNGCIRGFQGIILAITKFIGTIIAGLAVLMFIYAGILFVTSAGEPGKIGQAKKVAIYAVIGVAISLVGSLLVDLITAVINGP